MTTNWISVSQKLPQLGEVVLCQHEEDLYPVVAYRITKIDWMLEHEGAEDDHYELLRPLLRSPTHWMPLPDSPRSKPYDIEEESK